MIFEYTAALIRERIFPGGCGICGTMLLDPREAWYGLCDECRTLFFIQDEKRCSSCGRPLISEAGQCLACRAGKGHGFDGAFVLYPYNGIYRKLLYAYKFRKRLPLANFLAEKMMDAHSRLLPAGLDDYWWVPVPPRPGKIRKTGWDQISYLARRLRIRYGARICPCLKRLPSRSQKRLDRENRKTNLMGRIICKKKAPAQALLFDDVITTGSTLEACTAALKAGGAQAVYAFSLFYD